jgi:hypothetical protein
VATKYASQKTKDTYVLAPGGLQLDWYGLADVYPDQYNDCFLVALDRRQLAVLSTLVQTFLPWYWLWNVNREDEAGRSDYQDWKENLEYCLMAGCKVEDLIKTQRMMIAAMTGQSVDLDSDLPTTYSPQGITPTLDTRLEALRAQAQSGQNTQHADTTNVVSQLVNIGHQIKRLADDEEGEAVAEKIQLVADVTQALAEVVGAVIPT